MIKLRTASALAVGAVAALAIGGTALAAGTDDSPSVDMLPNGDVITSPTPSASSSSDDSGFDDSASPSPSASTDDSTPSPSASASSAGAISLARAKTIAVGAAGGGRVTGAERETEHGRAVWDIDVLSAGVEHDIDVDRATGEVLRHRTKSTSDGRSSSKGPDDNSTHDRNDDHGGDRNGKDDSGKDDSGSDDHGRHGGHGSDD